MKFKAVDMLQFCLPVAYLAFDEEHGSLMFASQYWYVAETYVITDHVMQGIQVKPLPGIEYCRISH